MGVAAKVPSSRQALEDSGEACGSWGEPVPGCVDPRSSWRGWNSLRAELASQNLAAREPATRAAALCWVQSGPSGVWEFSSVSYLFIYLANQKQSLDVVFLHLGSFLNQNWPCNTRSQKVRHRIIR